MHKLDLPMSQQVDDILDRLRIDPGHLTLGQLLRDREAAFLEIQRLRLEIGRFRQSVARSVGKASIEAEQRSKQAMRSQTLMSLKDVCRLLSISRSSIYARMEAGLFPEPIRVGARAIRWRVEAIEAWVEALEIADREGSDNAD
jgi:prophage regulatory protein